MRHILITTYICVLSCLSLPAQPPQPGGRSPYAPDQRPDRQGQRPQGDRRPGQNGGRNLFAEIPDLTFVQYEQLVDIMTAEADNLRPLLAERSRLSPEPGRRGTQSDARTAKKFAKIDALIKKIQGSSDKVIRNRILSPRQYQVFSQYRARYTQIFDWGGERGGRQIRGGRPQGDRPAGQGMPERRGYSGADSSNN